MKCAKCGRQLTRPSKTGYGPKCVTGLNFDIQHSDVYAQVLAEVSAKLEAKS